MNSVTQRKYNFIKHQFVKIIGLSLTVCIVFSSCDYDPVEPEFGYIYINSAILETTADQGEPTSDIKEAWIAVDGEEIGTYVIPGIIPIPSGKDIELAIFPGIRKNDLLIESTRYPLYQEIKLTKDVISNQVDTIDLVYHYKDNVKIDFLENFEGVNGTNGFTNKLDTSILALSKVSVINSNRSNHGDFNGYFILNDLESRINLGHQIWTSDLEMGGAPVWLEIDCKTDTIFTFLIRGIKNGQMTKPDLLPLIFGSKDWKKVYLDLRDIVNTRRYDAYQIILFSAIDPAGIKEDVEFKIDNIKIIHL